MRRSIFYCSFSDPGAEGGEIDGLGIVDEEHRVRVAHVDGGGAVERAGRDIEPQRVLGARQRNVSPVEAGLAHVDGDGVRVADLGLEDAGQGLDAGRRAGRGAGQDGGDAACGVAAGADLGAVGVVDAHEGIGGGVPGGLDDDHLVAAHAGVAIGERARAPRPASPAGRARR